MKKIIAVLVLVCGSVIAAPKETIRTVTVSSGSNTTVRIVYRDIDGSTNLASKTFVRGTTNWCPETQMVQKVKQAVGITEPGGQ